MQYKIMRQFKLPLEFKAYGSFRMTGDVKCLEVYKKNPEKPYPVVNIYCTSLLISINF